LLILLSPIVSIVIPLALSSPVSLANHMNIWQSSFAREKSRKPTMRSSQVYRSRANESSTLHFSVSIQGVLTKQRWSSTKMVSLQKRAIRYSKQI
jgi:hypothetical protein